MTPALHQACARALHVVTREGRVLRAGRATLFILSKIGWGWLARILMVPPFVWLVEGGYRLVANHRAFFSRFLFRAVDPREVPGIDDGRGREVASDGRAAPPDDPHDEGDEEQGDEDPEEDLRD